MKYLRKPLYLAPLLVLALLALSPISASAQSKGDVENAKSAADRALEAVEEADAELAAGLEELESIQGQIYNLNWRIDKLAAAITEYGLDVTNLQERARNLVIDAYIAGNSNAMTTAFTSAQPSGRQTASPVAGLSQM